MVLFVATLELFYADRKQAHCGTVLGNKLDDPFPGWSGIMLAPFGRAVGALQHEAAAAQAFFATCCAGMPERGPAVLVATCTASRCSLHDGNLSECVDASVCDD